MASRTPPVSVSEELMQQFRDWLRIAGGRLYRHELEIDVSAVSSEVAEQLGTVPGLDGEGRAEFLHRVCGIALIEALRSAQAQHAGRPRTGPTGSDPSLPAKLERVITALGPEHQEVVSLALQGLTPQEIAELSGWGVDQTRSLVAEGHEELQRLLLEIGIEYAAD